MIKLDKKNQQLIAALINNCRSSDSQLGKQTGLSREVIAYRIKKLEEGGIIKGYTTDINFNKLGFFPYSISAKLQNITKDEEVRVYSLIKNNKKIIFLQKTINKYDFTTLILVKTIAELKEEVDKIRNIIGKKIKFLEIEAFLGDYDFLASFFGKQNHTKIELSFLDSSFFKLDEGDKKILQELVENSRMSAVEISGKTKMSVFTIANKIKKLVKNKVILGFRPIIDMEKLGYGRYTLLANINDQTKENEIITFCRNHPLIWDVGRFIGNNNYSIEVYAKNNEEFKKVIEEFTSKFNDSIIDYETLIVIEELKHKYFFM